MQISYLMLLSKKFQGTYSMLDSEVVVTESMMITKTRPLLILIGEIINMCSACVKGEEQTGAEEYRVGDT